MMKNKSIKKDLNNQLIFAIILSVLFVIGIPLIIFGVSSSITFLLVLGIIFVVLGFYGTPIIWTSYANKRQQKMIIDTIIYEHILTVSELAKQLQISEKLIRQHITTAIQKKYIVGYLFDGKTLSLNEKTAPKKKLSITKTKCPHCGGTLEPTEQGYHCPYCGAKME